MASPVDKTVDPVATPKHVGDHLFMRLLGLGACSRLFPQIRSDKDVLVLDSVLSSFFAHHGVENIDLENEESFWPMLRADRLAPLQQTQ